MPISDELIARGPPPARTRFNQIPPEAGSTSHPASIGFLADREQAEARFKSDMTELLVSDGYEAYQQFQRTLPHWSHVTNLATHLFRTETPLQPAAATQLRQCDDATRRHRLRPRK